MSNGSNIHKNSKILLKHVNFSNNLRKEVQILQEEVNWATILNKEDSYDVISSVANQFIHDVNKLIYNLHQIMIKINKNQSSYSDLKVLVNKLSKSSFDLQEVFGQEFSVLKSKVITQIQNIAKEAQSLLRIVENVELQEFKTELVDFLSEIVSDLQKVLICDHLKQLSKDELEKVFNACERECRDIVAANHLQHETCIDKTILDGISRHTLYGVISAQRVAFHLHKVAYNYNDPIKSKINQVAKDLNIVCINITIGMYEMNRGDEGTSPLDKCMVDGFRAFRAIMNLSNLVDHCDKNGKDRENLKNLIFYGLSNTLCLARRFIRDMSAEVLQKI